MYTYKYPRPALTTDAVVWGLGEAGDGFARVLLIRRKNPPFQGFYALPGGFVDENEAVEDCVHRELEEETGLKDIPLVQMRTFSQPGRDPRGHTVSVVFFTIIDRMKHEAVAGDDAKEVEWVSLGDIFFDHQKTDVAKEERTHLLAFDHYDIISYSALFVYRALLLCQSGNPYSQISPFYSILSPRDKEVLIKTSKLYEKEFVKFRGA